VPKIGLKEMDYWRSETGPLGRVGFSALASYGLKYGIDKFNLGLKGGTSSKIGIAAFTAQMLLPGFDQGIGAGLYTGYKNLDIARSAVGEVTLMNSYRRTMEGLLPGISDWKTGALVGLGAAMASGFGAQPIASRIFDKLNPEQKLKLGISTSVVLDPSSKVPRSVRSYQQLAVSSLFSKMTLPKAFGSDVPDFLSKRGKELFVSSQNLMENLTKEEIVTLNKALEGDSIVSRGRLDKVAFGVAERIAGKEGLAVMQDELALRFEQGLAIRKSEYMDLSNKMNLSFVESLEEIDLKYSGKTDIFSSALRFLETSKSSFVHSFFGASKLGEGFTERAAVAGYKSKFGRFGSLFLGGMLAQQVLTGGLLGSMESPGQLNDIYSGREMVEIRRGRWWEGGGSSFEGKNISYYRPHDYVLYMSGATDKARYKVNRSPIHNFLLENFLLDWGGVYFESLGFL